MAPLRRVWWQGALVLWLFLFAGTWYILNSPARTTGVVNVARLVVEPLPPPSSPSSPSSPSPALPALVEAPSNSPLPPPSSSPSSSPSSTIASSSSLIASMSDRMTTTRNDIMARYARFMAARDVATRDSPNPSWPIGSPVRVTTNLFISDYNLHQTWGAPKTSYVMMCSEISPMCEGMTPHSLLERFYHFYQPPRFYPSMEVASNLYRKNSTNPRIHALVRTLKAADFNEVATVRRGWNVDPPAVAVVFNGWVTKTGSVLGDDVFAPMWPDSDNIAIFREQYFPTAPNQTSKDGEWRKVKEVVVISHTHQGMFWHLMLSEFFRIFPMLPYIQANEDVYIHLGWAYPHVLMDSLYALINIPKERILFNTKVQADIVYLTQFVDRNDVPSLGMTRIISESLHNYLEVPSDQRLSALATEKQEIGLPTEDLTVNILLIVRKVDSWRGRSVANYEVLKQAIVDLALAYPAKLQRLAAQAAEGSDGPARFGKLNVTVTEHLPSLKPHEVMKLYSRADIVAGPHGAGLANLFAARPGTHVVELITARHLNLLTTSRLGLTYHACVVANTTRQGIHEKANPSVVHFVADVPFLAGLIESILDSRFLRQ